jgi:HSP20 family protein
MALMNRSGWYDPSLSEWESPWNLLPSFGQLARVSQELSAGMPACDFVEKPDRYEVCAELPGYRREDVQVTVEGNNLQIKAERQSSTETGSGDEGGGESGESGGVKWHRVERRSGSLFRSFRMPQNADLDKVSAKSENGVLTVLVPKKEGMASPSRKSIAIA